jgi:hypothetical protein
LPKTGPFVLDEDFNIAKGLIDKLRTVARI